ncbi:MAG: serine/threonine protein kinase [Myxococcaceae bacterium]|nr:serine/threonine protein kinase [Myxococcaceae bacterium]MCA3015449.1 serine/threonine protein kinase [Myxococcaceae bacterium]
MSCLDDDTLLTLAAGRLSGAALEGAEQHLDTCTRCRRVVAAALESSGPLVDRPQAPAAPGAVVGRYLVLERVGVGASGQVLAAWDPHLGRRVALKLLRRDGAAPAKAARLRQEAQLLARLSHPHIVTVFDIGEWNDQTFVALEFVGGGSLREWLRGPPRRTWRDVVECFVQVGRGLAAAHRAGVIHRDVKPENLLLREDGRVQVTDFGLAFEREAPGPDTSLIGTPAYMAPAQLEGAPANEASDQFSCCVALFEALTGARPWTAQSVPELTRAIREQPPVFPPEGAVPPGVRQAVLRGLSASEGGRWPSMDALVSALEVTLRPKRRVAVVAGGAALGLTLLAAALTARDRLPEACALGEQRLRSAWTPQARAALERQFLDTKLGWAPTTFETVAQAFDARADVFGSQYREACLASRDSATPRWTLRMGCLEERMAEVASVRATLEEAGRLGVIHATEAIDRLPPTAACLGLDVAEAPGVAAGDAPTRQRLSAIAARVATLHAFGQYAEAERLTRPAAAEASTVERGLLWGLRGRTLNSLGRVAEARRTLEDAALAATELRAADQASQAYSDLAQLTALYESKVDEARRLAALARAWLPRSPGSTAPERLAAALGAVELRAGNGERALAHLREGLALTISRAGKESPQASGAAVKLADALIQVHRLDDALPLLEEAFERFARLTGPEHPACTHIQNSFAILLAEQGHLDEALARFTLVFEQYSKTYGATHPVLGWAAANVAETHERSGSQREALRWYQVALEEWTSALGAAAPTRVPALAGVARTAFATGDAATALAASAEALEACAKGTCDPLDEGTAALSRARVLLGRGDPRAAIGAAADRARAAFVRAGPRGAALLGELDGLLRSTASAAPTASPMPATRGAR